MRSLNVYSKETVISGIRFPYSTFLLYRVVSAIQVVRLSLVDFSRLPRRTLSTFAMEAQAQTECAKKQAVFDPWMEPYFFQGGFRRVAPYHFAYRTNCKERWRGRPILDVFGTEFRDRPREYYVRGLLNLVD